MSIFGTFRRNQNKKLSIDQTQMPGLDSTSSSNRTSVFSSTPNLSKIDQNLGRHGKALLPNKMSIDRGTKEDSNSNLYYGGSGGGGGGGGYDSSSTSKPSKWSFDHGRRSSSTAETWTGTSPSSVSQTSGNFKKSRSMRHFMSMMNVMGSLKRSKSIRKLGWGSTMNITSKEGTPTPITPGPGATTNIYKPSPHRSTSKSEECLDDLDMDIDSTDFIRAVKSDHFLTDPTSSLDRNKNRNRHKNSHNLQPFQNLQNIQNTEPGVLSSGSSSESSSVNDTNSIKASSERSDALEEESDEEGDMKGPKDPEEIERKKTLLQGTKKFNMDPKKGIEFLVDKGILLYTCDDVARFLKDGYGLSKGSIGNYLGERIDFNEQVLKAFVELHDFRNLILVQALRQFLWGFRLPGESQKISRMLDAFAERYCQNNPGMFSNDTCSVLCYSIIMLNTELHNPNVKEKATLDQFIKRNRGIEGGELLSPQFMASLYTSILTEPFRFPEEDGNDLMLTFFNPDYEGWLHKYGGRPKSWKRLWFILSNNCLYFFKFTTDKTPRGIIPLENILVRVPPEKPGSKLHSMILYKDSPDPRIVDYIKTCKTLSDGQTVPKLYVSIQLGTQDRKERERWVKAINANHSMSRFYSDLTLKKMKAKAQDQKKTGVSVRKSQISLPASVLDSQSQDGAMPVPPEVLQDPRRDPKNFFSHKDLPAISLGPDNEELRTRSRSESRLYGEQKKNRKIQRSRSPNLVMSRSQFNLNHSDSNDLLKEEDTLKSSNSSRTLPRSKQRQQYQNQANHTHLSSPILTPTSINLRTETVVHDRFKKLSMIQEKYRSDSISSECSEKIFFGNIEASINENSSSTTTTITRTTTLTTSARTSTSSNTSNGTDNTEFEYTPLTTDFDHLEDESGHVFNTPTPIPRTRLSSTQEVPLSQLEIESPLLPPTEPVVPLDTLDLSYNYNYDQNRTTLRDRGVSRNLNSIELDNNSNPIQIIDYTNATKSKLYPQTDTGFNLTSDCPDLRYIDDDKVPQSPVFSQKAGSIPEMCYESIYESNV